MVIWLYNQPLERYRLGKRLYIWEIVITHDFTIPTLLLESMWQSRWERPFSGGWRFFRSFSSPVPQDEASPCRLASITENETNNHETNPVDNDEENTDDQWMIALALPFPRSALGEMCEHRLASNGHLCGGPACSERWPSQVAFRLLIRWLMISMVNLCWLSYERLVHISSYYDKWWYNPYPYNLNWFWTLLAWLCCFFCVQWQDLV